MKQVISMLRKMALKRWQVARILSKPGTEPAVTRGGTQMTGRSKGRGPGWDLAGCT